MTRFSFLPPTSSKTHTTTMAKQIPFNPKPPTGISTSRANKLLNRSKRPLAYPTLDPRSRISRPNSRSTIKAKRQYKHVVLAQEHHPPKFSIQQKILISLLSLSARPIISSIPLQALVGSFFAALKFIRYSIAQPRGTPTMISGAYNSSDVGLVEPVMTFPP